MSKRQEIRKRRQRERTRNRILVIFLVAAGALLIAFAFIRPLVLQTQATAVPVISITPKAIYVQADGVHLGDPNAPVKVDVYEDFRCVACKNYTLNYESQVIQTYVNTGQVYYTYHALIIMDGYDNSGTSYGAANAAWCAAEQGHFWDYHDVLYANQITEEASYFTDDRLVTMAQNLNLDMSAFSQCFEAKRYASDIQDDIALAQSLNLTYTPSILVDGILIESFGQLTTAIDAALAGK
jgi:protein-disulfide isomerase